MTRKSLQFANDHRYLQPDRAIPFTASVASVGTPATVWTPGNNARFRFMGVALSASVGSVAPVFKDSSSSVGTIYGPGKLSPNANTSVERWLGRGYIGASTNSTLQIDSDTAGVTYQGTVFGREEP